VARANYQASVEQRNAIVTQEVALVQRFQTESRNAVQSYRSALARLSAATGARVAAEKVAASEVRRFQAGASTTYLVLQRQVMLANERNRELQAQTDVQNALVELDRVSGDILAKNNVDVTSLGSTAHGSVPDLLKAK
jgi:outer membrane protein TolC